MRDRSLSAVLRRALSYSFPVFLGYLAIGVAFGLLLVDAGYPAWLAAAMSLTMYAGAAQFLAVTLFASGAPLAQIVLVTLVVNARHLAYGLSLMGRMPRRRAARAYVVFALTDETFALLSSLPADGPADLAPEDRDLFKVLVAALDQSYWVLGSVLGAAAGSFLPFKLDGLDFALTALFIVLMVEQAFRVRRAAPFAVSAAAAVLATFLVPANGALLTALGAALAAAAFLEKPRTEGGAPC